MHPDILGWIAAALMVATFSCREARALRPLAVATNLAFIGYGLIAGLAPVLVLHLLLLPINLWRWAQACGLGAKEVGEIVDRGGRALCTIALAAMPLLAGCGGGGDEASTPPPAAPSPSTQPAPGTIGAAGGIVASGDGAEVSVPAGALTQPVTIEVRASGAGAPAWPSGVAAYGAVYAFTPHGTSFAVLASVVVPFDPARVPAGTAPVLYKTDATGTRWEPVPGAVVVGATMRGEISGFSYLAVAAPALQLTGIYRLWVFKTLHDNFKSELWGPPGRSEWGLMHAVRWFAGPPETQIPGLPVLPDGEVGSTATGETYGARATGPSFFGTDPQRRVGMSTDLTQIQYFRKRDASATLKFTISKVQVMGYDYDPRPLVCRSKLVCDDVHSSIDMEVRLIDQLTGEVYFHRSGTATVIGTYGDWRHRIGNGSEVPLWRESDFDYSTDPFRDGNPTPAHADLMLRESIPVQVPLDRVPVGARVALHANVFAWAMNQRQSESRASAFLRDPQDLGGMSVEHSGLEVAPPATLALPGPFQPQPAAACASGPVAEAGTLQFERPAFDTAELSYPGPTQWVTVTRTGGSRGRVSARVTSSDETARAGADYEAVDTHVVFADGEEGERMVRVPVVLDDAPEPAKTLRLALDDVRGCAALGDRRTATLTIHDDDAPPAPAPTYKVGGSVSGLVGSGLVLQDAAQFVDLPIAADGTFQFGGHYAGGAPYDVRVKSPPTHPAQVCTVARGSGTVGTADVADVEVTCAAPPAPTGLDASFGTLGKVVDGLPGGARAIARQSTGHILATNGASLVRFHADGRLDTSFGGGAGKVDNLLSGSGAEVADLAVGGDDRIVVAGRILQPAKSPPFYQMAAARLLPDGTRDTGFGSGGTATFRLAGAGENATRVLVQPDGRVVLVGQATPLNGPAGQANNDIAVVRLTADGAVDASFGTGGATLADAFLRDFAFAAALQPDGRIFVAGRTSPDNAQPEDTVFTRLSAAGAIEPGFGRNPAYSTLSDEAVDVALQPDGKLVLLVVGRGTHAEILMARLNADGSADTTFGSNGVVRSDIGPHDDLPRAVALQPDGKIVVAAQVSNPLPVPPSFAVLRYDANGSPDAGFGTGGVLRVPFFGSLDSANDLLVQPDGRVIVAGAWRSGLSTGIALIRLIP